MRIDDEGKDDQARWPANADNSRKLVNQQGPGDGMSREQRRMTQIRDVLRVAAWLCLAGIAFATLAPIGWRPTTMFSPSVERFTAFALAGALFAAGYPRYLWIAASVVLGSAVLFELLQVLEPSRHGRLFDAAVKIAGGLTGLTAGWLWARLLQRMR